MNEFLIGNSRHDNAYIHTFFSGMYEGVDHFRIYNEIWGHDIDVSVGAVQDIFIDRLTRQFFIQRRFCIWGNIPVKVRFIYRGRVFEDCIVFILMFLCIPVCQKHDQ